MEGLSGKEQHIVRRLSDNRIEEENPSGAYAIASGKTTPRRQFNDPGQEYPHRSKYLINYSHLHK